MEVFKKDSLIRVGTTDKNETDYLKWGAFKKGGIFSSDIKEGYHEVGCSTIYSQEELENGDLHNIEYIIEDKKVYYKPYATLTFVDGEKRHVYFDTIEKCEKYAEEMVKENFEVSIDLLIETINKKLNKRK